MIKSYFNFIRKLNKRNDEFTLYNSRTGCLSLLDEEHYFQYMKFPDTPIEDEEFLNQLRDCGYIVDSLEEEYEQIRYQMYKARFATGILNLVIAPTMNCNFSCTYCYEKNRLNKYQMSEEVQDTIIRYIEDYVGEIRKLKVQWYGGEPLLATKIIDRLNERILSLCTSNGIECSEEIITNGYLLDKEHIKFLNNYNIKTIQVTIDGKENTHDSRRIHQSGVGTYRKILENLKLCKLYYNGRIDLRVNVDKGNINEINDLVEELKRENLYEFVNLYLGRVSDTNKTTCGSDCLSCKCFAEENIKFIAKNSMLKPYLKSTYPHPIGNNCAADYNLSLVIDPNGNLYKCHMEIGQIENIIGNIMEMDKINFHKLQKTLLWDPTRDKICSNCKYLPVCMGGCAKERTDTKRLCDYRKYILDSYLDDISYIDEYGENEEHLI